MGFSFADNGRINIYNIFSPLHLLNGNRYAVWDLLIQTAQRLLPDQLRYDLTLWLVSHGVLIIKGRSIGQIFHNTGDQLLCIFLFQGRNRNDLCKIHFLPIHIDKVQQLFFLHHIDLVDHKDDRCILL